MQGWIWSTVIVRVGSDMVRWLRPRRRQIVRPRATTQYDTIQFKVRSAYGNSFTLQSGTLERDGVSVLSSVLETYHRQQWCKHDRKL